jgi:tRNA pseudouridine55 synthase
VTLDGLLLVDKPEGPTSHDVVTAVRRATGERRIGHTGTLDPPATGLLVLLLGAATRLAPYVPHEPKSYTGTFRLGVTTTTDDLAGDVVSQSAGPPAHAERVRAEAHRMVGTSWQVPPAISAKRVAGQRLYRAARRGVALTAAPARIDVARFVVAPTEDPATWCFEATVSSGTFIRGLVRDLGASLGCGAAVASLRRTRIGPFEVARALDGRLVREGARVPASAIVPVDFLPLAAAVVTLDDENATAFRHGRKLDGPTVGAADGVVAVRNRRGELLGMGTASQGALAPRMVLSRRTAVAGRGAGVISSTRSTS